MISLFDQSRTSVNESQILQRLDYYLVEKKQNVYRENGTGKTFAKMQDEADKWERFFLKQ